MTFRELKSIYSEYFSLGYINAENRSSIENKFVLISLICYVTYRYRLKNPDITYYEILTKINKKHNFPESFVQGLSIMCESFGYQCQDFPTFGLKGKNILIEIDNILKSFMPF